MAEISTRDLHVDQLLTSISISYKNPLYIADAIAPIVPVRRQSDIVPKYDQSHWFRNQASIRAPGTRGRSGGFTVDTTDHYYCPEYRFEFEIPDENRDNTDLPYDLDRDGTEFVTDRLMMAREISWATKYFRTTVWGADVTPDPKWDVYGQTDSPLVDLTEYGDDIEGRIARYPNLLVLGKQVWSKLKWHPLVVDTIKYTQRAQFTTELLASAIEIERVLLGRAIKTDSPEGTPESTVVYSRIWGKNALMLYVPPRPALMTPAATYTFTWQRVPNSISYIRRKRDDLIDTDILMGSSYFDQHITSNRAGQFINAPIS